MVRQRHPPSKSKPTQSQAHAQAQRPLPEKDRPVASRRPAMSWRERNQQWIGLAVASGACAAFNGVFAKLTTTDLTSSLSSIVAGLLKLSEYESVVEFIIRCIFFALNLIFNGVMWTLFTAALARGHSTTQVSIMNTSSNFVVTAILGLAIFSESLPPLWWVGAAMLVAGNVIIGRKDEGGGESREVAATPEEAAPLHGDEGGEENVGKLYEEEDVVDLGADSAGERE